MSVCPNCNRQYKGQPYFCNYCGYPLYDLFNKKNEEDPQLEEELPKQPDQQSVQPIVESSSSQPQVVKPINEEILPNKLEDDDDEVEIIDNPEDEIQQEVAQEASVPSGLSRLDEVSKPQVVQEEEEPQADASVEDTDKPEKILIEEPKVKDAQQEEPQQEEPTDKEQPTESIVEPTDSFEAQVARQSASPVSSDAFVVVGTDDDEDTVTMQEDTLPTPKRVNMVDDDSDDDDGNTPDRKRNQSSSDDDEEKRHFNWLALILFLLVFGGIGYGVYWYFNVFAKEGEQKVTEAENKRKQAKEEKVNRRQHESDSIKNAREAMRKEEIEQKRQMDSLYLEMNAKERIADSINRAKRYLEYAKDTLGIKQVLAIKETKRAVNCYYIDREAPLFSLKCLDMRSDMEEEVVGKMEARLVYSFETPDHQHLIVLCKDDSHKFGMVFKIDMSKAESADYPSQDKDGNKCYDVKATSDGFYMSFGKKQNDTFKSMYKIYYDKFGNQTEKK